MFWALIKTMRPRQWTKNVFVFAAIVFDRQLGFNNIPPLIRTIGGFVLFCLLSGVVYLINDVADVEADRRHPQKRNRPIASGELPIALASGFAVLLILVIFPLAYWLSPAFALVAALYLALNLAYSMWLKHMLILDVMAIAAGFVLRVAAGVSLIHVARFSPWLYVVTTLVALYIGFGKRRAELALLAEGANAHRKVLDGYSIPLLDHYITIAASTTVVAYCLYTFSAPNLPDNHAMMLTIPFVVYGIFRYLAVIKDPKSGGTPEEVMLKDRPLQITILLWGISILAIFYIF